MNYEINCEFVDPVNLGTEELPDFEFSDLICTTTENNEALEYIENLETGAGFFLSKTIDYGDLFLMICLVIIFIFSMFKFLWNLMISKKVNFKK